MRDAWAQAQAEQARAEQAAQGEPVLELTVRNEGRGGQSAVLQVSSRQRSPPPPRRPAFDPADPLANFGSKRAAPWQQQQEADPLDAFRCLTPAYLRYGSGPVPASASLAAAAAASFSNKALAATLLAQQQLQQLQQRSQVQAQYLAGSLAQPSPTWRGRQQGSSGWSQQPPPRSPSGRGTRVQQVQALPLAPGLISMQVGLDW